MGSGEPHVAGRQALVGAAGTDERLAETKAHLRASVKEGIAAARSLAEGASELTERAIDRLARRLSNRDGEP